MVEGKSIGIVQAKGGNKPYKFGMAAEMDGNETVGEIINFNIISILFSVANFHWRIVRSNFIKIFI